MQFIPEILLIGLLISLYSIFLHAKDNFVLLRKNVTLEQLFNMAFLSFFLSIFLARIVYVGEHISLKYLNPLVFLLFPYFPGLSFAGGVIGCFLSLYYFTKRKKLPFRNILDIFSFAIFLSTQIGIGILFIIDLFIMKKILLTLLIFLAAGIIVSTVLSLLFSKNNLKDGSIGFLSFALLLFDQFLLRLFLRSRPGYFHFAPEDIILGLLTFVSIILIIWRENTQERKKK